MSRTRLLLVLFLLFGVLSGCGGDDAAGGSLLGEEPEVAAAPRDALLVFFDELQEHADHFEFHEGEFLDDYGDAAFFGVGFYARAVLAARDSGLAARPEYEERGAAANAYNMGVIEQSNDDPQWMVDNLEEVYMAMLGAIEFAGVTGDHAVLPELDALIELLDVLLVALDDYLDISIGEFASNLYGATSITAGFALVDLQYALYFDNPKTPQRLQRAREIAASIHEKAWDTDHYRFDPDEERLFLYPNATMLIVLNRLYEITGEREFIDRAETVFTGIQALSHIDLGFYQSPYSAIYQGAQTSEYGTLSAQNYLNLGLLLLYENTGDERYRDEALTILDFVRENLFDETEAKILHHWIDGRVASLTDPDYFCSGCNMQYLYIVQYLIEELGWQGRR